jgi:hypothetical protein
MLVQLPATRHLASIFVLLCAAIFCTGQSVNGSETRKDGTALAHTTIVKRRIQSIMQATLKEGEFTTPEGIKASTRVPPSTERIEEVRQLGDGAIPVLASYVNSKSPREQELAMRFLAGTQVWNNAVRLSGELKVTAAAPALAKWIGLNTGGSVTFAGTERLENNAPGKALAQIGNPAVPALIRVLEHGA